METISFNRLDLLFIYNYQAPIPI